MLLNRTEEIRKLAYQKAQNAGFPQGRDMDFWLEAEAEFDVIVCTQASSPREIYSNFMQRFYELANSNGWNDDYTRGLEFLALVNDSSNYLGHILNVERRCEWGLYDISIMTDSTELGDFVKRSLLMCDTSLIAPPGEFQGEWIYQNLMSDFVGDRYSDITISANLGTPDSWGKWLKECEMALKNGSIFILPKVKQRHVRSLMATPIEEECSTPKDDLIFDAIVKSGKAKTFWTKDILKQKFITFLAEVELPIPQHINLPKFVDLYYSEIDAANSLKSVLREHFLNIEGQLGAESFMAGIKKSSVQLARDARHATNDLCRLNNKRTVHAAGAMLAMATGILVALNLEQLQNNLSLISGGIGLSFLYSLLKEHQNDKAKQKDNPCLFLWLLQRNS
jgi:hypothetical protein